MEPLDARGYVDYLAASNERMRAGVTEDDDQEEDDIVVRTPAAGGRNRRPGGLSE